MKAMWLIAGLAVGGWTVKSGAQDVVVTAGVTVLPTTVVAEAPPTAPALPAAPVVDGVPPVCSPRLHCRPVTGYRYRYSPNVVYFGGPYSQWRNYWSGNARVAYPWPYSPVVYFGRGEAWERGYYFQHRR